LSTCPRHPAADAAAHRQHRQHQAPCGDADSTPIDVWRDHPARRVEVRSHEWCAGRNAAQRIEPNAPQVEERARSPRNEVERPAIGRPLRLVRPHVIRGDAGPRLRRSDSCRRHGDSGVLRIRRTCDHKADSLTVRRVGRLPDVDPGLGNERVLGYATRGGDRPQHERGPARVVCGHGPDQTTAIRRPITRQPDAGGIPVASDALRAIQRTHCERGPYFLKPARLGSCSWRRSNGAWTRPPQ
jgi:hypothetical protein